MQRMPLAPLIMTVRFNSMVKHITILIMLVSYCLSQNADQVGDLNQDSELDIQDIVILINMIIDLDHVPTEYELWAADVNDNSDIDILDLVVLINTIIGNTNDCPEHQSYCWYNLTECCYEITSHSFEWTIETFGVPSEGNDLWDAFILAEDDIWLVGELYTQDEDGNGFPDRYNLIHWNGFEWEYLAVTSPPYHFIGPKYSIYGFSPEDLWVSSGIPQHYNGSEWGFDVTINGDFQWPLSYIYHSWGTRSSSMFFGEATGDIVLWDGSAFNLMETSTGSGDGSETDIGIKDIWGLNDENIWAIAGNDWIIDDEMPMTLLHYNGDSWEDQYSYTTWEPNPNELSSFMRCLWAYEDTLYVSTGWYGIWKESISTGEGYYAAADSGFYDPHLIISEGLRGNHYNDIYTVSWHGKYGHYNGEDWFYGLDVYNHLDSISTSFKCKGLDVKGNTVILYGHLNSWEKAWVARGSRID